MRSYRGGLLVISHDIDLLDESITRVIHLDEGQAHEYKGTYSLYISSRAADEERREKVDAQREADAKRMKTLADKMRGQSAKRAKAAKALDRRVDTLRAEAPRGRQAARRALQVSRSAALASHGSDGRQPRQVIRENDVFSDLNFTLDRGQRMCLIGFNGAGKSTLLKLIAKITTPTEGSVEYGTGVSVGYYDQEHGDLDVNETVIENARKNFLDSPTPRRGRCSPNSS